jgi:hypothetical protein
MTGQTPLKVDLLTCSLCCTDCELVLPQAAAATAENTTNAAIPKFFTVLMRLSHRPAG